MQYFKHYHNASTSIKIQKIIKEHGVLGYGQWFLLLELLCEKFDGESDMIRLTTAEVIQKLRTKPAAVRQVLARFAGLADILADIDGFEIIIQCPLLLDLQDKDFKHATKKRRESDAKNKIKNKDKEEDKDKEAKTTERLKTSADIHQKLNDDFLIPFLTTVKIETQNAWFKTYDDEAFVKTELMKACTWIINNSTKAPKKNFGQFFSTWLGRGWEQYRKNIPSTHSFGRKPTISEIAENQIANNPFREVV